MKAIVYFFVVIFMTTIFLFCKKDITQKSGKELAQTYCSSCHAFPSPDILDQQIWKDYMLPRMGAMMGHYSPGLERDSLLGEISNRQLLLQAGMYPEHPTIRKEEWKKIQQFYLNQAPKTLSANSVPQVLENTNLFKITYPDLFLSPPSTTYISIDTNTILFADANKKILFETDQNYNIKNQASIGEALVHLHKSKNEYLATVMGSFSPTELPSGYILKLDNHKKQALQKIIRNLQRPVHSTYEDFNNDNRQDILISEFGKWTGKLSLHSKTKDDSYQSITLMNRSGAIRTESIDYNNDQLMDFIALFGQGDEEIVLFTNKGNNQFETKSLLCFHPSMG